GEMRPGSSRTIACGFGTTVTTLTSGTTVPAEASAVAGSSQPPRSGDNPAIAIARNASRKLNFGMETASSVDVATRRADSLRDAQRRYSRIPSKVLMTAGEPRRNTIWRRRNVTEQYTFDIVTISLVLKH